MTSSLIASNILIYALQATALIAAAGLLSAFLKLQPALRLFYLQTALFACLLLPFVRSWKSPEVGGTVTVTIASSVPRNPVAADFPYTPGELLLFALAAGILGRAIFLAVGFRRLRAYRLESRPLSPETSWSVEAAIRVSPGLPGPVTFGFFKPVVVLPESFSFLDAPLREAILCHEILHVRRKDWVFMLFEEAVRTVFWFHPAIWWLLSEIQLAREQTVDLAAISMVANRDSYVDALVAIGSGSLGLEATPAPLFLSKGHLKRRMFSILKEVKMSKSRMWSSLAAATGMLAASVWVIPGALPLQAAPQAVQQTRPAVQPAPDAQADLPRVRPHVDVIAPVYPPLAKRARVQGIVSLEVASAGDGSIQSIRALSGPPLLIQAATNAVLHLTFKPTLVNGSPVETVTTVDVHFTLPEAAAQTQPVAPIPGAPAGVLRVHPGIEEANILEKTTPAYPPLAKAARVQGIVSLEIVIGRDGSVLSVGKVTGPPLLIQAAKDAVSHWIYKPTLLNGNPVEVVTTVDVNFTLSK